MQVEFTRWLIQPPESFNIIGVEFEQLSDEPLRDLLRCQVHPVQGAEERQQVEPGVFQARAQIRRDLRQCTAAHGSSMTYQQAEVNSGD